MTPHRPCVVGFGELVWDVLPHATHPGGAPANFVWHAQQLGAEGMIVSALGNDQPGRDLATWLRSMGLSDESVQFAGKRTGRVDVRVSATGEPGYVIQEDSSWDVIQWTDALADLAQRADCICFGTLAQRSEMSRATLHRFLNATRPDCLRIFDLNLRRPMPEPGVIERTLAFADVLKLNEDEWSFVSAKLGLDADWSLGCRELLRAGKLRLVALTRGAEGSVLMTDDETFELPADPVKIETTIGAGDAFAAALAVGLLRGLSLSDIQQIAATTAAFVCTNAGAMPRLPQRVISLMNTLAKSPQMPIPSELGVAGTFVSPTVLRPAFDGEAAESH